ncbi:hypothetical protein GCM10023185_22880 [Hymenobacter saemangeumensis]|uniref:Uncharacterized protein n=1 Tax=Hymenobacter saemangeumensis TaxID=1084522 RepID=A0ABP8IFI7_9BACT
MHDSILNLVKEAHALTESLAVETADIQQRKQLILADLSLHLVQAALRSPQPDAAELKRYLFGILTVSNGFVDDLDLKAMAAHLMAAPSTT